MTASARWLGALLLLAPMAGAMAQSMEPRAYSNLPVGLNIALAGYVYSRGELAFDNAVPLENGYMRVHAVPLGYVRSLDVLGKAGSIGLVLPLVHLRATATSNGSAAERSVSGLGDPTLRLAWNFYGAPALSAKEFAGYRQDLIVGTSLTVTAPFGQYDSDRAVNIGANRWSFKPELGASQALGAWTIELAGGVTFYTRNDDYFGGNSRSQEPIYSTQLHVTRQLGRGVWAAVSGTYFVGGRSSINGVENDDRITASRVAATLALPVDRQNSIKLVAASGVYARSGTEYNSVGMFWQHLWGG